MKDIKLFVFLNDHLNSFVKLKPILRTASIFKKKSKTFSYKPIDTADEHLAELMPIFERIRAQEQVPCAFPIHMGAGGTVFVRCNSSRSVPLSPHVMHCHPTTHLVSFDYYGSKYPPTNLIFTYLQTLYRFL